MAYTYSKIASYTVGSSGVSSIEFLAIPQTYTDLIIKMSLRTSAAVTANITYITFNSNTSNYSHKFFQGTGSAADAGGYTGANSKNSGIIPGSSATSNTFSNTDIYIPNYTSGNYKPYTLDSTGENNGTTSYTMALGGVWSDISPINSIRIEEQNTAGIVQYSTVSIYGVKAEV